MKGRGRDAGTIQQQPGAGGRRTAACGVAASRPDGRRWLGREVEDGPVMVQTGRSGPRWPGCGWAGVGISKENRDGLPWPLGRIDGLNRRAYRKCF
jgi:hypothetical protein